MTRGHKKTAESEKKTQKTAVGQRFDKKISPERQSGGRHWSGQI